ncbi:MAG: cytochrome bc1 complex diheme cytochrome c subunit [Acidimicrobiales bacterium]
MPRRSSRNPLRSRMILPAAVLVAVGLGGTLAFATGAGAQSDATATTGSSTTTSTTTPSAPGVVSPSGVTTTTSPTSRSTKSSSAACSKSAKIVGYRSPKNSGSPTNSSSVKCVDGHVSSYGSSAITYKAPPKSYVKPGEALFEEYCSSCHLPNAEGSAAAPNLVGLGPATVMFWVTTGRMPAATPLAVQAPSKPQRLTYKQAEEVAAFVNSLAPSAPYIPTVHLKGANRADGATLFALNCAACHTITGAGDALATGTFAPSIHYATAQQVAEAIRTGPANMPRYTGNLTDSQVRDLVAFVTNDIQHPTDLGGAGLGGVGPVAEGFVALVFGVGIFMLVCFWIGDRA